MCNIVSGIEYSSRLKLKECSCGFSLRTGSLILGYLQVIEGISQGLYFFFANNGTYWEIGGLFLKALFGILLLIGVYKNIVNLVWSAVYFHLIVIFVCVALAIVLFVHHFWAFGVVFIFLPFIEFYILLVFRSYAFDMKNGEKEEAGEENKGEEISINPV